MARAEVGLGSVSSQCGAKGMALPGAVTYLEEEAKQLNEDALQLFNMGSQQKGNNHFLTAIVNEFSEMYYKAWIRVLMPRSIETVALFPIRSSKCKLFVAKMGKRAASPSASSGIGCLLSSGQRRRPIRHRSFNIAAVHVARAARGASRKRQIDSACSKKISKKREKKTKRGEESKRGKERERERERERKRERERETYRVVTRACVPTDRGNHQRKPEGASYLSSNLTSYESSCHWLRKSNFLLFRNISNNLTKILILCFIVCHAYIMSLRSHIRQSAEPRRFLQNSKISLASAGDRRSGDGERSGSSVAEARRASDGRTAIKIAACSPLRLYAAG
ncbi:hypothetical protein ALC53_08626 [Atta colombica]|uniref:Uncharacterized protein n=1 Tax=Atta colombica TaxID=520822 RepID=A0A151I2I6_9HYME|nr:hypothetical protein ALC53_08626 [Atta colombica]